jgi:proline racemase
MTGEKENGMLLNQTLVTVSTHSEGQPTKVLLSGIPYFQGRTMQDKREYIQRHFDHLRLALCREPRGHNDQTAAIVTEPVTPGAHFGFLTMDAAGHWADMSVSTAIAVTTVACQYGIIVLEEPVSTLRLDTPSGVVAARVTVRDGRVDSVSVQNVPSFFVRSTVVDVPGLGSVPVDISFGGNFFGFVRASDIGIKVSQEKSAALAHAALAIRDALNVAEPVQHPEWPYINRISSVVVDADPLHPEAAVQGVCVFGEDGLVAIDRSPCGTGLCARMATMYARQQIGLDQLYGQESIVGTVFKGRLVGSRAVGQYDGMICEISGRAYVTGVNVATVDMQDPLRFGYSLN